LGNPEGTYKGTRHNIGFEVVNKLAFDNKIKVVKNKFRALTGEGRVAQCNVLFVKPQTYMNLSGESVLAALKFFKKEAADIIVVYDDISLELGEIRIRERGSAGGQKGMKDIIAKLGTEEFIRVRVGIGNKPENWDLADYVLSKFKPEEFDLMVEGVTKAGDAVLCILTEGVASAMNRFNRKSSERRELV
jgi:PTH1 family peptidyl-tRNA hydrolase